MGYKNIQVFSGGIPEWVKEGYPLDTEKALPKTDIPSLSAEQLNAVLQEVLVLDLRPESLYEMGAIKGSLKIPLASLSSRYQEIPKGKKVVAVDHSGSQVLVAGRFLKSKGFEDVDRLQGGLLAWVNQGLPLEK